MALSNRTAWNREPNALSQRRAQLEREGRRLVDLTVSNPTDVGLSPSGVGLPAVDVYAPEPAGLRSAREAVARWLGCAPEQIVLSASTSEAYAWLFKLLCDPGDEVLVPSPAYPLLDHLAQLEGVTLRRYPLRYDGRWTTDAHAVEGSPRTRAVVAVSPGNPTGTYLSPDEARALSERGWPLIVDEVFADPSRSVMRQKLPGLTFALGGLSKAAGLPQLKLAWTAVLRVPQHPGEEERCLELLERGVVVHPGYFYDFPSGAHLVLSLLPEPAVFAEGVARLTSAR